VLPAGWELVGASVGGHDANISSDSWKGRSTMLCVRRRRASRAERHVVDITVAHSSKVPEGYERVSRLSSFISQIVIYFLLQLSFFLFFFSYIF